jgi:hypothetical protein
MGHLTRSEINYIREMEPDIHVELVTKLILVLIIPGIISFLWLFFRILRYEPIKNKINSMLTRGEILRDGKVFRPIWLKYGAILLFVIFVLIKFGYLRN